VSDLITVSFIFDLLASYNPLYRIVPDRGVVVIMTSEKAISELENKRKLLNERLMDAQTLQEANEIERELWAIRAAIRYRKRFPKGGIVQSPNPEARQQPGA
jgi:hypothetical protein